MTDTTPIEHRSPSEAPDAASLPEYVALQQLMEVLTRLKSFLQVPIATDYNSSLELGLQ